ncbi:MAG: HAMP domain-containing histidine kinase [Flavobacterium sp.]|nr:HAMP domain-containing histidine kinase [Pedobacter sp.]
MKGEKHLYRKNFTLIIIFLILTSFFLVIGLLLAYNLTTKNVENEFSSKKIDVLDQTLASYNNFFQNKIPQISFYQGFLDSSLVSKYADTILFNFPFVERLVFYDTNISNHQILDGIRVNSFSMGPKTVYQFGREMPADSIVMFKDSSSVGLSLNAADEFNKMAVKFAGFIESADTTKALSSEDIFKIAYNISSGKITYMNIPRAEELRIFKDLMFKDQDSSLVYEQDLITFFLDPYQLKIKNTHPELYANIVIKPLVYESLDNNPGENVTETPLPGALADYKLYFSSHKGFLKHEINIRFLPVAISLLIIYITLILIAYLIFRNLHINSKMFELQYDFINNLTHEFKTPVSVIKIAGNNIRSARQLSDRERLHYGKILDEEADKLNDMMNMLLSFTQIENKAINLKEETIDMETFCQNIIDAYQIRYPAFIIRYRIEMAAYFKGDPVLLRSIFQNLIDNAYKYSFHEKKELDILIEKVKKNIVFTFTDQGIGIKASELENIFKKFYRIQSQYNQQGSIGLGLAFCKELVNFMKGTIAVRSVEGKGSEFKIILPMVNDLSVAKH